VIIGQNSGNPACRRVGALVSDTRWDTRDIPALGSASFGLAQRIFVATWLSWMITTAIRERRTTFTKPATQEALDNSAAATVQIK
jgi:hypothetical protein